MREREKEGISKDQVMSSSDTLLGNLINNESGYDLNVYVNFHSQTYKKLKSIFHPKGPNSSFLLYVVLHCGVNNL